MQKRDILWDNCIFLHRAKSVNILVKNTDFVDECRQVLKKLKFLPILNTK